MKKAILAGILAASIASNAEAQTTWANWSLPSSCTGDVTGTFGTGTVTFSGPYNGVQSSALGAGSYCTSPDANGAFAFNTGGVNYWQPTAAYNPLPDNASFIQQVEGVKAAYNDEQVFQGYVSNGTRTVTFSEAIIDPYIALISVGSKELDLWVEYQFDRAFTVLSYNDPLLNPWGPGFYEILNDGKTLRAKEFSGIIQFSGSVNALSFTLNTNENWHGFSVGAPTQVPEPASILLLSAGVVGLGAAARRRHMKARS
ncbi:MAG: VPLPA-CTERM sorting domain-containing protein [Gemmatimonadaceae bacterium]|nr:VPLPA-CTERM sorting domain-containing protein [Gemmatimonadaceae bacterium]